jgi:hypothetical protein
VSFYYVILDRDGGEVHVDEEPYATEAEADKAASFWEDDPRYGSHEVIEEADK